MMKFPTSSQVLLLNIFAGTIAHGHQTLDMHEAFTLVRANSTCWSRVLGDRIGGPAGGSVASCARWALGNAGCGDYFEVDAAANNWCGCGSAASANEECQEGGSHPTSTVYRLALRRPPRNVVTVPLRKQDVPVVVRGRTITHKTAYFGTVYVGLPTPQPFKVVFDTGSGHFLIPSSRCRGNACLVHKRYNREASESAIDINWDGTRVGAEARDKVAIKYGTGDVTGDFSREIACVGVPAGAGVTSDASQSELPAQCTRLRMITALEMSEKPFKEFEFDGVLGLGLGPLALHPEFHFLTQMVQGNRGVAPVFGVSLARRDGASEISVGGHNDARITGPLKWAPVLSPDKGYWLISIHQVWIGGKVLDDCSDGSCVAIVDTGTSLLGVPKKAIPSFHAATAREAPAGGTAGVSDTDCRHIPGAPLVFDVGGFDLRLDAVDYTRPAVTRVHSESNSTYHLRPGDYCVAQVLPIVLEELGPKVFIFGEPFFLKYYTAYDAENKRMGFASSAITDASGDRHLDLSMVRQPTTPSA